MTLVEIWCDKCNLIGIQRRMPVSVFELEDYLVSEGWVRGTYDDHSAIYCPYCANNLCKTCGHKLPTKESENQSSETFILENTHDNKHE